MSKRFSDDLTRKHKSSINCCDTHKETENNTGTEGRNGEGGSKNIFVRARKASQAIPVGLGKAADKARAEMG